MPHATLRHWLKMLFITQLISQITPQYWPLAVTPPLPLLLYYGWLMPPQNSCTYSWYDADVSLRDMKSHARHILATLMARLMILHGFHYYYWSLITNFSHIDYAFFASLAFLLPLLSLPMFPLSDCYWHCIIFFLSLLLITHWCRHFTWWYHIDTHNTLMPLLPQYTLPGRLRYFRHWLRWYAAFQPLIH